MTHALVKVPNEDLEQWDDEHDVNGNDLKAVS